MYDNIFVAAVSLASMYDNIFVFGEDIDLLVILKGLAPMMEKLYFRKCGNGGMPDVIYSSFKYKCSKMILFIHAFSGCDTTRALFCQGKAKFGSLSEKHQYLQTELQILCMLSQ
ncbi:hypothetical protein JTE90_001846 [Oedothorax gibbosus]|uniref:Uncharacterized protein n=1 Tax=Oedothorax gibbosus TaxID=931172 RepID=A0AAV6VPB2_9ARAC|nr:hypothetical protein JTE90_001846 [Oedothorax gibbosus]